VLPKFSFFLLFFTDKHLCYLLLRKKTNLSESNIGLQLDSSVLNVLLAVLCSYWLGNNKRIWPENTFIREIPKTSFVDDPV